MKTNIIRAIINLVSNPKLGLMDYSLGKNRANNMGEALEEYVKDLFAGTVGMSDGTPWNEQINKYFSYIGNQNNPPDSMLRGGDAIEVKKIMARKSNIALNSSYPKAKLFANSNMISNACRECEEWTEKDLIYVVGVVSQTHLMSMAMIYGMDYAAEADTYERIRKTIKYGVETIPGIEFAETNELGRINRVDPLGITSLRVRGMWHIDNPFSVFNYVFEPDYSKEFNFMAIINKDKYETLDFTDKLESLVKQIDGLSLIDVKIKAPNNPAVLNDAKCISFVIEEDDSI